MGGGKMFLLWQNDFISSFLNVYICTLVAKFALILFAYVILHV